MVCPNLSLNGHSYRYLQAMRQWYSQQMTKLEFDQRVREFASAEARAAHNRFLLALFNKCSALADIETDQTVSALKSETTVTENKALIPKVETKRNN